MELWTAPSPNGWKVSIMLEELQEAGVTLPEVEVKFLNLQGGDQFSDEFTAISPNQKIPGLVDGDIRMMESCAILQYLGEKYPSPLLPDGYALAGYSMVDMAGGCRGPYVWQQAELYPLYGRCAGRAEEPSTLAL